MTLILVPHLRQAVILLVSVATGDRQGVLAVTVDNLYRTLDATKPAEAAPQSIILCVGALRRKENLEASKYAWEHHVRSRSHSVGKKQLPLQLRLPRRRAADAIPLPAIPAKTFHRTGHQASVLIRFERFELD